VAKFTEEEVLGEASVPVNRPFQVAWFNPFKRLHYGVGLDSAFCFICRKAVKGRKWIYLHTQKRAS